MHYKPARLVSLQGLKHHSSGSCCSFLPEKFLQIFARLASSCMSPQSTIPWPSSLRQGPTPLQCYHVSYINPIMSLFQLASITICLSVSWLSLFLSLDFKSLENRHPVCFCTIVCPQCLAHRKCSINMCWINEPRIQHGSLFFFLGFLCQVLVLVLCAAYWEGEERWGNEGMDLEGQGLSPGVQGSWRREELANKCE